MRHRTAGRRQASGRLAARHFGDNAALLDCCDIIISTADSSIDMGGSR